MRIFLVVLLIVLIATGTIAYTQLSIFSVQPIGAVPEGRTVLLLRNGPMEFIDSADAICMRTTGSVTLLCRGAVLGRVSSSPILLRLPYQRWLYLISTDGREFGE
jgi:hypothetical protein